jgi:hypothetical protein
MRPAVLLPAAALLLLAAPQARAGRFECPARGGDGWREVCSAHFVLQTDLSSRRARNLAAELERTTPTIGGIPRHRYLPVVPYHGSWRGCSPRAGRCPGA